MAVLIVGLVRSEAENAKTGIDLSRISQFLDYTEYGGAPLLGVNGVSIICHGGSPPRAIVAAIRVAVQAVESHMVKHIQNRLARLSEAQSES